MFVICFAYSMTYALTTVANTLAVGSLFIFRRNTWIIFHKQIIEPNFLGRSEKAQREIL